MKRHQMATLKELYKTALVTGASHGGLGRHIALDLARRGLQVVLVARRRDSLESVAKEITGSGGEALPVVADITQMSEVERAFSLAREQFGDVDLLINNAGTILIKPFEQITPDEWRRTVHTIIDGTFHCCSQAVPAMLQKGRGCIINISATSAVRPKPLLTAFNAGKYGLHGLTQALALELRPRCIHVAELILDGVIDHERVRELFPNGNPKEWLDVRAICEAVVYLATQDVRAWTHELTLTSAEEGD
jgi:3-oxoacyl-[acyl-carrier protein] reductase